MHGRWLRAHRNGVAIVFIHGVLSDEHCWRHENGTFWPEVLTRESSISGTGVYVFEYNTGFFSGTYRLGDVVAALKNHLRLDKVDDCHTVIFVCHSMGGIVARRYIVQNEVRLIEARTRIGLFLIASPSLGSDYALWLAPIARTLQHTQADALRFSQTNSWLADLDEDFINLKERGQLDLVGKELVEDRFVILPGFFRRQVVPPFSGARYFGDALKIQKSDHFTIAKISGPADIQNRLLVEFAQLLITPDVIKVDDGAIALRFGQVPHADLVSCTLAVERLCLTDDPVRIEWPQETEDLIKILLELSKSIVDHQAPESIFHGMPERTLADFAGSIKSQLDRVDRIKRNATAGARRTVRGMTPYWPVSWDTVLGRTLRNYLTICNVDILMGISHILTLKGVYDIYYPKHYSWFMGLGSEQIYARIFEFGEPAYNAKVTMISGRYLERGNYFWGPSSEILASARWQAGEAITTTWFDKYLIGQNEFHQILAGENTEFSYNEQLKIVKILDEENQEVPRY